MLFPVNAHLSNCEILFIPVDTFLFTPPSALRCPHSLKNCSYKYRHLLLAENYILYREKKRERYLQRERDMDNGSHDGGSGNVGFHSYRRSPRPISAPTPSSGMLPSISFTLTNTLYNTFSPYIWSVYS